MKILLSIPNELLHQLDVYCESNGYTRSEFIRMCIRSEISSPPVSIPSVVVGDPVVPKYTVTSSSTDADDETRYIHPFDNLSEHIKIHNKMAKKLKMEPQIVPDYGKRAIKNEMDNFIKEKQIKLCKHGAAIGNCKHGCTK